MNKGVIYDLRSTGRGYAIAGPDRGAVAGAGVWRDGLASVADAIAFAAERGFELLNAHKPMPPDMLPEPLQWITRGEPEPDGWPWKSL